jgi:hypothetical protein
VHYSSCKRSNIYLYGVANAHVATSRRRSSIELGELVRSLPLHVSRMNHGRAHMGVLGFDALSLSPAAAEHQRRLHQITFRLPLQVNKELRMKMYKKHVEGLLSSGTGVFDEAEVYEKLPTDLGLDVDRVKKVAQDLARERKKGALVQSISLLRQKRQKELAAEVRNLIAADRAVPETKVEWGVQVGWSMVIGF